ncbi:MAG: penicillin acylase family protein, partial [Acidobacteriota bacterium]
MGCSVLTATRGRQLRAAVWLVCAAAALWVGCGRGPSAPAPPDLPGASGTVSVAGLASPVRVVRDRWGVPHISAANTPDLFFAQGFVQAQDRLFQMDLWRRSAQGRLAEVLGSNFVGRDAMTRRIQFHGAPDEEWARLGEETRTIATAFVQGINAWVALARQHPPEAFVLAGWQPDFWQPEDLLNRTDAFLASGGLSAEVFRARLVAAVGASRADALLGLPAGVPTGFDPRTVTFQLAESLKQIGAPPFFVGLRGPVAEAPPTGSGGSNAWALAGARTATGVPVVATDPHRALSAPSTRYLVHLSAPGWNVAGATAPWLPGVAIGHNDAVAWGMTASDIDTEDVSVERLNPGNSHQVEWRGAWTNTTVVLDRIWVKGRRPVTFEREYTPHGVVLAIDGERHLAFTLRWSGLEPGVGGELAALGLDRATSVADFRAALVRWQSPPVEVVVADTAGAVAADVAALVPMRRDADGRLPTVGWREAGRWEGWQPQATLPRSALPRSAEPAPGYVASANESVARLGRPRDVLARAHGHAVEDSWRLQQDVLAWNAVRLVPLLARVHARRPDVESARQELLAWDRRVSADSAAAAVYVVWEQEAKRRLAAGRAPADLADELAARASHLFVVSLTHPS